MSAAAPVNPLARDLESILEQTRGLWEDLRGQHIFVTGGTGFFGRWLLESFVFANQKLELGAQMIVLSRNPAAFQARAPHLFGSGGLHFVQGNVRSFTLAKVREQRPDFPDKCNFVIHAATEASAKLNAEEPLRMLETIVEGTRSVLDFAVECKTKRFLLTSSGAVYGQQLTEVTHVEETSLTGPDCSKPDAAYAEGKRLAELLCACYQKQHGLEPLLARCFAFVGPFLPLDLHFAIGNFIRDALSGGPICVGGDGTPRRSYLYATDLMVWLWTILFRGQPGRPYNVGSSHSLSIAEVAESVRQTVDPAAELTIAKTPVPGVSPARYVPNTDRARKELGLREQVKLNEAIRRTALAAAW